MIKQITYNEFYKHISKSVFTRGSVHEAARRNWAEVEWWATNDFRKLGSITFDNIDGDCNVVVLERKAGRYLTCDVETSFKTQHEASMALQAFLRGERKSNYLQLQQNLAIQLNGGNRLRATKRNDR